MTNTGLSALPTLCHLFFLMLCKVGTVVLILQIKEVWSGEYLVCIITTLGRGGVGVKPLIITTVLLIRQIGASMPFTASQHLAQGWAQECIDEYISPTAFQYNSQNRDSFLRKPSKRTYAQQCGQGSTCLPN